MCDVRCPLSRSSLVAATTIQSRSGRVLASSNRTLVSRTTINLIGGNSTIHWSFGRGTYAPLAFSKCRPSARPDMEW